MLYIWKNCFATSIRDIKTIDLIEYLIDLELNVKFIKEFLSRYITKKKKFINQIFSKFENIEIIVSRNNF